MDNVYVIEECLAPGVWVLLSDRFYITKSDAKDACLKVCQSMKKHKKLVTVTAIILALLIVFGEIFGKRIYNYFTGYVTPKITSQSLPIKAELSKGNSCIIDFYKERSGDKYIFARNPWDMQTYNGRVYISSGDYSENSVDTPIYYYDLKSPLIP